MSVKRESKMYDHMTMNKGKNDVCKGNITPMVLHVWSASYCFFCTCCHDKSLTSIKKKKKKKKIIVLFLKIFIE